MSDDYPTTFEDLRAAAFALVVCLVFLTFLMLFGPIVGLITG
ncbi:hypothetical protein X767_32120 [Mesorhizobium sp. LSJC264A00]|nr:hypothetical protein X767_32120 [Mesorhizobium sp. LSJC264A00]